MGSVADQLPVLAYIAQLWLFWLAPIGELTFVTCCVADSFTET
jgi:hypothetical protein